MRKIRLLLFVSLAAAVGYQFGCGSSKTPETERPKNESPPALAAAPKADQAAADDAPDDKNPADIAGAPVPDAEEAANSPQAVDSTLAPEENVPPRAEPENPETTTAATSEIVRRLLLLTGGGPLVVDVALTVDGRTSEQASDEWIDQLLAAADTDENGEPTWDEAVASPRLGFSEFAGNTGDQQERIRMYDRDRDGVVDRWEMWTLVSHGDAAGIAFRLSGADAMGNMAAPLADVQYLLDLDDNGQLSAEEIAAAPGQLKLADVDDDDLLDFQELERADLAAEQNAVQQNRSRQPLPAVQLDEQTSWGVVFYELKERYHYGGPFDAKDFPLVPHLVDALDQNENGELDRDEVAGLVDVEPHLVLAVALGVVEGDNPARLEVAKIDPRLGIAEADLLASPAGLRIDLPGMTLEFSASDASGADAYAAAAQAELDKFDADKNAYLELHELEDDRADDFAAWDANGDGRVFLDELTAAFQSQRSPLLSRIEANVAESRQSLFAALDVSRDSRLSAREIQQAAARFRELDQDGDGRLVQREMPGRISVVLRRGPAGPQAAQTMATFTADDTTAGPAWFVGMDSNRDGDVSRREFLGPMSAFDQLDTDADGFLSAAEAGEEASDVKAPADDAPIHSDETN